MSDKHYYAIAVGRVVGVYFIKESEFDTIARPSVRRFPRNTYKRFDREEDAIYFMRTNMTSENDDIQFFDNSMNILKVVKMDATDEQPETVGLDD